MKLFQMSLIFLMFAVASCDAQSGGAAAGDGASAGDASALGDASADASTTDAATDSAADAQTDAAVTAGDTASTTGCQPGPASDAATIAAVVQGNNAFALDLFGKLSVAAGGGNVFFSPLSISTALAMTYAGAGTTTATQMAQVLHFTPVSQDLHPAFGALACQLRADGVSADGGQFDLANAVFGQKGFSFQQPFMTALADDYGAGLQSVDFAGQTEAARLSIDAWVSQQTHGKIPELLKKGSVTPDMTLVLADALYFEGLWSSPFEPTFTANGPFTLANQQMVQVPLMTATVLAGYAEGANFTALELPFKDGHMAMDFVRPTGDLAAFEAALSASSIQAALAALKVEQVAVAIPKFQLDLSLDLIPAMQALGLTLPFGPQADFSGIDGQHDLSIGLLHHEAVLQVDEAGATAAAATATGLGGSVMPTPAATFKANRPFILLIRDVSSGILLFVGHVTNPLGS